MTERTSKINITSFALHIMAMAFMLCDHLWATIVPGNNWLTCIGRLAFPIFAFLITEGYFRTKNLKKYVFRLLLFAIISEIPFNLMFSLSPFYPFRQNVIWTFLIAIGLIHLNEKTKGKGILSRITVGAVSIVLAYVLGFLAMVDYYHAGILTVLVFYFFRKRNWISFVCQILCLYYINVEMLGGFGWEIPFMGNLIFLSRQGLALLALIPIWLYKGEEGPKNKFIQYSYYIFYPLHLLVLTLIMIIL